MNSLLKYMSRMFAVISCALLCTVGAAQLQAQQSAGAALSGTVLDPVGGVVSSAFVIARNESSGVESKATTNAEGKFSIPDLAAGTYTVEVSAPGFARATHRGLDAHAQDINVALTLGSVNDAITVQANTSGSLAAQNAPMDGLLEARSARTEVTPVFIQNFTSPVADFGELVEMAPGTFSVSSDGIGLGQDSTYFRGFPDGDYNIDFDGVPFYDTNTPTHHTWAFFPSPWVGSVDFDRSPGSASTIGPTPFGGSIHLLSPGMSNAPIIKAGVSYGSYNTILVDGSVDSGQFLGKKANLLVDVQHITSDGFETFNYQIRNAGSLKYVYKFSENNLLTAFSGVVWLDSNTPKANPTLGQINQYGYKFLLSNDSNAAELTSAGKCVTASNCLYPLNYNFYTYHIPTDFEYVDWTKQWGHGWQTDFRPYTLSYYNAQFYNNVSYNPDGTFKTALTPTSAVDKLNSYRKYGQSFVASQVSKYGIFRAGLWYEWATTNRYQIPSNPVTRVDTILPNFHETFHTNTYQPYFEYEYHVTQKLTVTGGFKYAYFNQNLNQYQDNGKTVGCLGGTLTAGTTGTCVGGVPFVNHSAGYSSYLPSVDANYHIMSNWSVYGQFGTGTVVPPSSVFDVTGANVLATPKPTGVKTYQGGTVVKLKQITLNADVYYTHYQNAFTSITDPDNNTGFDWISAGDSVTKGFEGELNVYLTRGLSFYVNGTVGKASYVSSTIPNAAGLQVTNPNYRLSVANTPSDTEAFGLTYRQKHFDLGVFDKRVGSMWNDYTASSGAVTNQAIPIHPFSITNVYLNYVLRNGSHFDQTKFRFSVNNVFNHLAVVGVSPLATTATTWTPLLGDQLTLLPGRSFTVTITPAFSPKK